MSALNPRHFLIDDGPRKARTEHALQAAILVLSAIAIWLVAQPQPLMRWGHVVGLVSQPLWCLATWRARQWGMFLNALVWTGAFALGIHNHF